MTTATAQKAPLRKRPRQEPKTKFFQGKIGSENFFTDYITHTLKSGYWLLEGTQRNADASRTVIVFKYLEDRKELPSGLHTLLEDGREERFSVIVMHLGNSGVPSYTAEKGTIEFFHNEATTHVSGALDVSYRDDKHFEIQVRILFSS